MTEFYIGLYCHSNFPSSILEFMHSCIILVVILKMGYLKNKKIANCLTLFLINKELL